MIWGITFHNLKYLDKPIKCLEMRANIKSVRKINEIFLCIFTYIKKIWHFFHIPQFLRIFFFGYFKSQISKIDRTDFLFALISRHFIGLVWYFTGRRELYLKSSWKQFVGKILNFSLNFIWNSMYWYFYYELF